MKLLMSLGVDHDTVNEPWVDHETVNEPWGRP